MQEIKNRLSSLNDTLNKLIRFVKGLSDRLDKVETKLNQK